MSALPDSGSAETPPGFVPPPPRDDADRAARLRPIRSRRVGPSIYLRLLAEHGSAVAALRTLPDVARAAGVEGYAPCPEKAANAELRAAARMGARMICPGEADCPALLAEIPDALPIL